jgi:hypothetical protein
MSEDRSFEGTVTEAEDEENPLARNAALTGLLVAGAAYYLYRRSRRETNAVAAQEVVSSTEASSGALMQRGQQLLENTLDRLSEQAMADVKVILKSGLHRLEQMIDDL